MFGNEWAWNPASVNVFMETGRRRSIQVSSAFIMHRGRESTVSYQQTLEDGCCVADFPWGSRSRSVRCCHPMVKRCNPVKPAAEWFADTASCLGLCRISPSRVADLCLPPPPHNACPAVHSTDCLHDLHTGVSPYRVKETHLGLREHAHVHISIHVHFSTCALIPCWSLSIVIQCLYVSQPPLGRMERLSAAAHNSEADERLQPLPQTQFQR